MHRLKLVVEKQGKSTFLINFYDSSLIRVIIGGASVFPSYVRTVFVHFEFFVGLNENIKGIIL